MAVRTLLIIAALICVAVGSFLGLMPQDHPSCGAETRAEWMCVWSTPEERRPEALAWIATSLVLLMVAFFLDRRQWDR